MKTLRIGGDLLIKMKEIKSNCTNCGHRVTEEELIKNEGVCPVCGSNDGWFSDPVFFGFDEEFD